MTAPRQEKSDKVAAETLAGAGIEALVAALRSRVKDDAALYQACGPKSPGKATLKDFEPWEIADQAVTFGCLPPPEFWSREQALKYLRDAARTIIPPMSGLERHDFLSDIGFIEELERIEASLEARRSCEALDRLRRFIRPVWMAGPSGPAVARDREHQGERGGHGS